VETSAGFGNSTVSDVWELPPSNVFAKAMVGGFFGWSTGGPTSVSVAVFSARTQQPDGSVQFVPLGSDAEAVNATHMFWDPNLTEITFGLEVRNGIGWLQETLTFFG
jgi:hypothetical protein